MYRINKKNAFKTLVFIAALLFLTGSASAQDSRFGIKGGLNLSSLTIDNADENNVLPGFNAGVWSRFMLSDAFAFQPELLYSAKGVKTVYNQDFLGVDLADGETKLNLNYLEIPLHFAYYLANDFNFHVGPYVGVLMNASVETQAEVLDFINIDNAEDLDRSEFNTLDYGISAGLGFNLDPLIFGFNYSLGLNQVAKDGESVQDLLGDAKNNNIQVYVGIMF
ncbi:porin family protein [Saccharicrinis sp. FJH54]|uniref:porin family protein n=1 Tax=Saccharicrinis sp. FJH54 TaxID=3344665 RepID=UPI0035D4334D